MKPLKTKPAVKSIVHDAVHALRPSLMLGILRIMHSKQLIFRFLVWTLFVFLALGASGTLERRMAVAAGCRHSEDFGRMIQSADLWWKERAQQDPQSTIRAGREIRAARYTVRGVTAALVAALVVWFSNPKKQETYA